MKAHVLMLLKCASHFTCFLSACVTTKDNWAHKQTPLSNDAIDSVPRHREVVQAKDLSASPNKFCDLCATALSAIYRVTSHIGICQAAKVFKGFAF
jgi:hypothetical protein